MSIVAVHGPNMVGQLSVFRSPPTPTPSPPSRLTPSTATRAQALPPTEHAANDPACPANYRVLLKDGTSAKWNGTAWVVYP